MTDRSAPRFAQGSMVGTRYQLVSRLNEGASGTVFEARDLPANRPVALKILKREFCGHQMHVERFLREAQSAARIGHPNIIDVLDVGRTPEGDWYLAMELLRGTDLAHVNMGRGPLSIDQAASIATQCCRALGAAHAQGIVHRDLKPHNILLIDKDSMSDFVKIVDFGVAKLTTPTESSATLMKRTSDNLIVGTAEYISPEQAEAREVDHRSDIYALGVILFEMVTGHVPFAGSSAVEVMRKQVVEDIPRVRMLYPNIVINPGLEQVIYKALAKKADERFHSMREMELAIDHAVDEHHKQQTSLKPKQRVSVVIETLDPPSVRWGAWVAALLSVVLMGVAGWYLWQLRDKRPHPPMHNSYPNE